MRIAVTGAGGGVGRAFQEAEAGGNEVIPFTHRELPVENERRVAETLDAAEPAVILHLAAMTSVDGCEEDPERAREVNAAGTRNVARAASRAGAVLVAVSTDYVFDGEKGEPYDERDTTGPVNTYGRTKLEGESAALEEWAEGTIVARTSWIFGAEGEFVRRSIARLAAGQEVGGLVDQIGTPTYVRDLVSRFVPLARSGLRGVVHLAGSDPTTWFEVLGTCKGLGNLPGAVIEQKAGELGRSAPRPRNSALKSVVLGEAGIEPLRPLEDALAELVEEATGGR